MSSSACNVSQQYALNALLGSSPPSHVASFGNTTVENVASWIPVHRNLTTGACSVCSTHCVWVAPPGGVAIGCQT